RGPGDASLGAARPPDQGSPVVRALLRRGPASGRRRGGRALRPVRLREAPSAARGRRGLVGERDKAALHWAAAAGLGLRHLPCRRAYYVGFFNDDAFYIIGARSLLQGRYAELNAPGQPPLVNYPPGTSLLLAPVAFLAGGSLWPYQVFAAAASVAGLAVLFL